MAASLSLTYLLLYIRCILFLLLPYEYSHRNNFEKQKHLQYNVLYIVCWPYICTVILPSMVLYSKKICVWF